MYCLLETEVALKWYQSTRKEKLSGRQIFFRYLKWTPSREEHTALSLFSSLCTGKHGLLYALCHNEKVPYVRINHYVSSL